MTGLSDSITPALPDRMGSANNKDEISSAAAAARLDSGYSWSAKGTPATVTYAYAYTGFDEDGKVVDIDRFTPVQIVAAEAALTSWSDVANISFVRVQDIGPFSNNATILFSDFASAGSLTGGPSQISGEGYYPGSRAPSSVAGNIEINTSFGYNSQPNTGNYGTITLVHEIGHAIGLSHPADYDALDGQTLSYSGSAGYYEDTRQYSVMSYFSELNSAANYQGNYASGPQLDDISAAQRIYGANLTTRTGDTVYGYHSTAGRPEFDASLVAPVFAVWDAGGNDTFDFSGYSGSQKIDLRQGAFSDVVGSTGNVAIAYGAVIENGIGGAGNDVIIGNAADNRLQGGDGDDRLLGDAGNDLLYGGAGADKLDGGSGVNLIDGGDGTDMVLLAGRAGDYRAMLDANRHWVLTGDGSADTVTDIEQVAFQASVNGDGAVYDARAAEELVFDPLRYIASYPDLIRAFGANGDAGFQHYIDNGAAEGRSESFDPWEYADSNLDVARAFGGDLTAIESHYILDGLTEGRQTASFDPLEYAASNTDLARAFGEDRLSLEQHYLDYGIAEGRPTTSFDPLEYAASNPDVAAAFGTDRAALTDHWLVRGIAEGRSATSFDSYGYAVANPDVYRAFGLDAAALETHYIQFGRTEGRSTGNFDPLVYAASNPDVAAAFGTDEAAITTQYLTNGIAEGRPTHSFDPLLYGASNPDLARAFGDDPDALAAHYILHGIAEGRATSGFDAPEYAASNPDLIATVGLDPDQLAGEYLREGVDQHRPLASFDPVAYMLTNSMTSGPAASMNYYLDQGYKVDNNPNGLFGEEQSSHFAAIGGSITKSTMDNQLDSDWFEIDAVRSGSYSFNVGAEKYDDGATGFYPATLVRVFNGFGQQIAASSGTSNNLDAYLSPGTYYLEVDNISNNDMFGYDISIIHHDG